VRPVRRVVAGFWLTVSSISVDAEVVGDGVHVQDPKDEPRDGDRADECARNQDQARDSVGREVSRACPSRPGGAYAGSDFVPIRLDTTPRAVGERRPSRQSGVWRTEPAKRDDGAGSAPALSGQRRRLLAQPSVRRRSRARRRVSVQHYPERERQRAPRWRRLSRAAPRRVLPYL
jgi:hypothetical protein